MRIAKDKIEAAELVIAVFDGAAPLTDEDRDLIRLCENKRSLAIINKSDLPRALEEEAVRRAFDTVLVLSAKNDDSLDAIRAALEALLGAAGLDFSQEILAGERQRRCCETALGYIRDALSALNAGYTYDAVNVEIDCAVNELLTLTGKRATEEVVNEVFRSFCVGK